jgi:hypothetical protein
VAGLALCLLSACVGMPGEVPAGPAANADDLPAAFAMPFEPARRTFGLGQPDKTLPFVRDEPGNAAIVINRVVAAVERRPDGSLGYALSAEGRLNVAARPYGFRAPLSRGDLWMMRADGNIRLFAFRDGETVGYLAAIPDAARGGMIVPAPEAMRRSLEAAGFPRVPGNLTPAFVAALRTYLASRDIRNDGFARNLAAAPGKGDACDAVGAWLLATDAAHAERTRQGAAAPLSPEEAAQALDATTRGLPTCP